MLNQKDFGAKIRNYRKNLSLTQEELAEKVGVSGQAVSKWEAGECLPDLFNLCELGRIFGVSLDILLETETDQNIDTTADKIKQLATEFVWAKAASVLTEEPNAHLEMGDDLWKMWKAVYFVEIGDRELQNREMEHGACRIGGRYGLKIWDDLGGIACVVKSDIKNHLENVTDVHQSIVAELTSPDYFKLFSVLDSHYVTPKDLLLEKTGLEKNRLNEMLIYLTENRIVEFFASINGHRVGYKLTAYRGILAYLTLAMHYILSQTKFSTSEYLEW